MKELSKKLRSRIEHLQNERSSIEYSEQENKCYSNYNEQRLTRINSKIEAFNEVFLMVGIEK